MTTAGVTFCSGAVLPAVSAILPVVTSTAVNDVLTSTLGQPNTEIPPSLDTLCSVGKTSSSKEGLKSLRRILMLMSMMIVIAVSPMEVELLRPLRKKVSIVLSIN